MSDANDTESNIHGGLTNQENDTLRVDISESQMFKIQYKFEKH
jgi:hypothetical protein